MSREFRKSPKMFRNRKKVEKYWFKTNLRYKNNETLTDAIALNKTSMEQKMNLICADHLVNVARPHFQDIFDFLI